MKKRPTILEAIGQFITARKTSFNADLVRLWSPGMETQMNVSGAGGTPVPDKKNWFTDGLNEWGPIRIPKDADSEPHFYDYLAHWPPSEHASDIGMSGWNWKERKSYWVGIDIDDFAEHPGTGLKEEEIEPIKTALGKLDYPMLRHGTSGDESHGLHIYVFTAGIPTANHDEHAALARAIVAKMAADTGLPLHTRIDVAGRILWFWSARASEEKRSYECLKQTCCTLVEDELPGWRDTIPAKPKREKTGDVFEEMQSPFPVVEKTAEHDRFFEEYQKRGWPFEHRSKFRCYHMHRFGMKETAEALGLPLLPTTSPGSDNTKANVKVYLRRRGFNLVCFADTKEGPEWGETAKGEPCLKYSFVIRPLIKITTDLDQMVEQSIRALRDDANTYQVGGILSEVVENPPKPRYCLIDNGAPRLREIAAPTLARKLSSCAQFLKWKNEVWAPSLPPPIVVNAVLSSAAYPRIPVITNVVSSPVLRANGTIARQPGLDRDTGLFLYIDGDYPDVMEPGIAIETLKEVVCDFPFVTENHRSAWIAALVTIVSRAAFPGPAPFFPAFANSPGAGKTLLFDAITTITENRPAARFPWPRQADEFRKVVTTVCLSGSPYLFLDNCEGRIGGPVFEEILTGTRWKDRLLGENRDVDVPLNFVLIGTGNNCTLTRAAVRRTCAIELRTDLEEPESRTGFKHPELLDWVKENRRDLVIAALSLPYHYIAAGRPKVKMEAWGSFEGWSGLVRASLVYAGLPDPDMRKTLTAESDEDTSLLSRLMDAWDELGGIATVGDAITAANVGQAPTLSALLNELPGNDHNRALGYLLREYKGRVLGGRRFERTDHKIPRWQLVEIPGPPQNLTPIGSWPTDDASATATEAVA